MSLDDVNALILLLAPFKEERFVDWLGRARRHELISRYEAMAAHSDWTCSQIFYAFQDSLL